MSAGKLGKRNAITIRTCDGLVARAERQRGLEQERGD